jgi:hypothetical protein
MKQWAINLGLLLLSIVSICIALFKVTPFEVTEETYVGIIVSLLALVATFVIAYQIYNAIELKKEIAEQKKNFEAILKKNEEMNLNYHDQENKMLEGFNILSSLIQFNSGQSFIVCGTAFNFMHHALINSIESSRTDYDWIFFHLRKYLSHFNYQTFASGLSKHSDGHYYINSCGPNFDRSLKDVIDDYLKPIRRDEEQIRASKNFCKIQSEYNSIMRILDKRTNEIVLNPEKQLSILEQQAIANPQY